MALSREALRRLALTGAKTRMQELEAERRSLISEFPELGSAPSRANAHSRRPAAHKGKRKMTTAERRAISKRMKALWAERRKARSKAA